MLTMGDTHARVLYEKFSNHDFIDALCAFMTSGPCVVLWLTHPSVHAVPILRALVGTGYPPRAGTLRGDFAEGYRRNVIHASDGDAAVVAEASIFDLAAPARGGCD